MRRGGLLELYADSKVESASENIEEFVNIVTIKLKRFFERFVLLQLKVISCWPYWPGMSKIYPFGKFTFMKYISHSFIHFIMTSMDNFYIV